MDTLQDRGHKEQQRLRLEADLAASIDVLFRRCPSLYGFSVQQASKVTRERAVDHLEGDLYLADVACHPLLDEERCAELCEVAGCGNRQLIAGEVPPRCFRHPLRADPGPRAIIAGRDAGPCPRG